MTSILAPVIDPLHWLLQQVHDVTGVSWAWSIILLTFIVRIALVPLTVKQQLSMRALQRVQPELKALQAKHRGDRQRLNEETMKFYREKGVNPFGSCLPLLVQIPIFIGLFYTLRGERFESVVGNSDKSFLNGFVPDITVYLKDLPTSTLVILMVVYVGSQVASTALLPSSVDPRQKYLFMALPVIFAFFIINQNFPAGLMLYWITSNLWTVGQAAIIRKVFPPIQPAPGTQTSIFDLFKRDDDQGTGGSPSKRPTPKGPKPSPKVAKDAPGAAQPGRARRGAAPAKSRAQRQQRRKGER